MAVAWSLFVVPKRGWKKLREAATALVEPRDTAGARLGIDPLDRNRFLFEVEHVEDGAPRLVEGGGLQLHGLLKGPVIELRGASDTEAVTVTVYEDGEQTDELDFHALSEDEIEEVLSFEANRVFRRAGFGRKPVLLDGWTVPLDGRGPDRAQVKAFNVLVDHGKAVPVEAPSGPEDLEACLSEAFADDDPFARIPKIDDPDRPLATLASLAARTDAAQRRFEPLDTEAVETLEASGHASLVALAHTMRERAVSMERDPIPHLRHVVEKTRTPMHQRPFLGRLALALDDANAPDAREALAVAQRAYILDKDLRTRVDRALKRRGKPAPRKKLPAGLPKPSAKTLAAYEALREELREAEPSRDNDARLARARFDAGFDDAGKVLEKAYIALGHASPMRQPLEDALTALGLF